MKTLLKTLFAISLFLIATNTNAQDKLHAYYKVTTTGTVSEVKTKIKTKLKENGLIYIGGYNTQGKADQYVIAFTNPKIYGIALYKKTHKAMASVMKFGIKKEGSKITVSLLNPEYIFYAYFRNTTSSYAKLKVISDEVHTMLKSLGTGYQGFGGQLSKNELKKYHYMMGMPYFTDPVELNEMTSFADACTKIEANLKAGKGSTSKVYQLKFTKQEVAIYGVALKSKTEGEASFLPTIGDKHIAALPYEIVVIGNKVMMLHGKYRLALHWPELTMGQFMKIVSTPGYIEDTMEGLTK